MKKLIFCYLLIPFLLSSCVYSDKHELSDEEKDEQIIKLKDDNLYLKARTARRIRLQENIKRIFC